MKVVARRREGFTHDVEIEGGHTMVIDEPRDAGGGDEGPSPTRTLGAALAACTAITCEMYAERKGWELGKVEVEVEIEYDSARGTAAGFEVTLRIPETLTEDQQQRLLVIAGKCPLHRVIAGETPVAIVDRIEPAPSRS
jgi:putative redox protein